MKGWQDNHRRVITDFLRYLNETSDRFILKGGTALLTCYNLDRFSEDIDLDGTGGNINKIVEGFCKKNGYDCRNAKDTATVRRFLIHYGTAEKPLKVEVSYRRKHIDPAETTVIGGINVYKIEPLCVMKAAAYVSRDRIRDLFDLTFIFNNYRSQLSPAAVGVLRSAVEYRGMEHFDYITETQKDELINTSKLAADFLNMYENLDLAYEEDREVFEEENSYDDEDLLLD